MKKFAFFLALSALILFTSAQAIPNAVQRRDLKLPTQVILEKQTLTDPVVADADRLLNDQATSDSTTTTATSFLAQPDVCRTLSITPGGTTDDVPAGDVTVTGTNIHGDTISEAFTFAANASTVTNGTKAFCSVTSIVFPIQDGAAATYDVGVLDALGLKRCMDSAGHVFHAVFDGAYEGTRPTCTADADEVEKNVCDINGTLNGSKDVELYFVQNFRCFP